MNKIFMIPVLLVMIFVISCSSDKNSNNNPVIPGGGGNNNSVTIGIRSQPGQNGGTEFDGKPNVDITITEVNIDETTTGFNDVIQGDETTVFKKDEWVLINEYTGVQTGMKFKFKFTGKTSPDGKEFNFNADYTVP